MDGRTMGASPDWVVTAPGQMDPKYPVFIKEVQITMPAATWLVLDEDQQSINDAMFVLDVGGSIRFADLPSRNHCGYGYGINFNDGHAEIYKLSDPASRNWTPSGARPSGGYNDWLRLRDVTTHPY
jgi:hypothetical protein